MTDHQPARPVPIREERAREVCEAVERVQSRVGEWDALQGWEPRDRFAALGENLRHDAMSLAMAAAALATEAAQPSDGAGVPVGEVERAVKVCPQCDGEGGYADGLDDGGCHTGCTRCGSNGWIVDIPALTGTPAPVASGAGGEKCNGARPLPFSRDDLGRFVREAWVRWAETQPDPKPSWLIPFDQLAEPDKEADRQIGEAVARWTLIGDAATPQAPNDEVRAALEEARAYVARKAEDAFDTREEALLAKIDAALATQRREGS